MALRHIALFQWIDGVEPQLDTARAVLADLAREHGMRLDLGRSRELSPSTYDFGLTIDFETDTAYQSYRSDPRHVRLMEDVLRPPSQHICAIQIDLD